MRAAPTLSQSKYGIIVYVVLACLTTLMKVLILVAHWLSLNPLSGNAAGWCPDVLVCDTFRAKTGQL